MHLMCSKLSPCRAMAEALEDADLEALDLRGQELKVRDAKQLAERLAKHPGLKDLDLGGCKLGNKGAQAVAWALASNKALMALSLKDNGILEEGARNLATALRLNTVLAELDLSHNRLGDVAAADLARALRSLRDLDLTGTSLGFDGAQSLALGLGGSSLVHLRLGDNCLGDAGAEALAVGLAESKLQELELSRCDISSHGAQALLKADAELVRLDLTGNRLAGLPSVGSLLPANGALRELDLSRCDLCEDWLVGDVGCLNELRLCRNGLGAIAAAALAEALEGSDLRVLALRGNSIGDEGAASLAAVLKDNYDLQELDVSDIGLTDEGAKSFGECLGANRTLRLLCLQDNKIGDAGSEGLAAGLALNKSLLDLDLSRNQVGMVGAGHLAEAMRKNCTLSLLELKGNFVEEDTLVLMQELVADVARRRQEQESLQAQELHDLQQQWNLQLAQESSESSDEAEVGSNDSDADSRGGMPDVMPDKDWLSTAVASVKPKVVVQAPAKAAEEVEETVSVSALLQEIQDLKSVQAQRLVMLESRFLQEQRETLRLLRS